jgi:bifunctional non-homologous end joining protein LigD
MARSRVAPDGRALFNRLLFRREWPNFMAFDLLWLDGNDLRGLPLQQRKAMLQTIMPRVESDIRYVDHVKGRGRDFFVRFVGMTSKALLGSGDTERTRLASAHPG